MKQSLTWIVCCCLLTVLTATVTCAQAPAYYFRHYQVENGLANNSVFGSIQDKQGFLWFCTREGLNRFDGYHFKLFKTGNTPGDPSSSREMVYHLYNDKQGTLWVGASKGIFRYDARQEKLVQILDTMTEVNHILEDTAGNLWFISVATVCRYTPATDSLTLFHPENYFNATSMCMTASGELWFATEDGSLQQYHAGTETFTRYPVLAPGLAISNCFIKAIAPADNHSLYIGTSCQGIKQFDLQTGTIKDVLVYNPDKTAIYVRDILQYSPDEYWFATESGIFILKPRDGQVINLKKNYSDPYSLSDNAIYTLCKDKEGGVWAGTFFGGVNYCPKQYTSFQKYFPGNNNNAVSGNAVREITSDQYGNIWMGTEDAGLNKLDVSTNIITHFQPTGAPGSITYSNIHGLLAIDNEVWIGTHEHGLDVLDIPTGKLKKHYNAGPGAHALKNNFILSIIHTSGNEIVIGTGNGVYRYLPAVDGFELYPGFPDNYFVPCVAEAHDKTIWIATHQRGIFGYNPVTGQQQHFEYDPGNPNSLVHNTVNSITEDSKYNLWVSTEGGGLCKINTARKTITRFTIQNGLPSNYVFKVVEDNNHYIWVTTSKGLVKLDPVSYAISVYTKANGLLNDQFNYNSGFKDVNGRLYFGSVRGMISFNPRDFHEPTFIPPVYITGFQVNNKELIISKDSTPLHQSVLYTKELVLQHHQSSFSIDFAATSFTSPEMTTYSYKMEGLDNDWTVIPTNRKAYFTNLSPGKYTFRVKAATNGIWSKQDGQLVIRILPPFWATWWAYVLYATCFIILAWFLVSSYHKRLVDKKEKEIYEAKIDFFTNVAHEIRTPLTLIAGPVENLKEKTSELPEIKPDVETMERNTNRLINLVSQVLDFRQTEARGFSLDFTKVNINAVLEETFQNFLPLAKKKNLQYNLRLPTLTIQAMADEEALVKIFNNLFSNAIKYGQHSVRVQLDSDTTNSNFYIIEFVNDGLAIPQALRERIFEPFYRMKERSKQKGTGIGLTLARSLAALHKGTLQVKDDPDGLNRFVLQLPLKPVPEEKTKPQPASNPANNLTT